MKRGFLLEDMAQRKTGSVTHNKKFESQATVHKHEPITRLETTTLSFGKVPEEVKALPDDYKQYMTIGEHKLLGPTSSAADYEGLIFTTLPQSDSDGDTEWLVNGIMTKNQVLRTPGYPARLPKTPRPVMVAVKEVPAMGLGLFAVHDIHRGDLIFAERPLLVSPQMHITRLIPHYTDEQCRQLGMKEYELQLKMAIDRMSPEDRTTYMSLANSHTEDGSGPIYGILRTNCYLLPISDLNNKPNNKYCGVGALGSRINHSCRPNVAQEFDIASFSFQFYATRSIKTGEQLFYSYCHLDRTAAQRNAELAPYGVVCKCLSCVNATPESDQLHQNFEKMISIMRKLGTENWKKGKSTDPRIHDAMLKLENDLIHEVLDGQPAFNILLESIASSYNSMGRGDECDAYLKRCHVEKHT